MKHLITIILILITIVNYSLSQEPKSRIEIIDSLNNELKNANDESKVDIYTGLSRKYFQYNTDTGMMYANKALLLSKEIGYVKGTAESYNAIALNFSIRGEIDSSNLNLLRAKELYDAIDDFRSIGDIYVILAINNNYLLNHSEAFKNLDEAIKIYDKLKNIDKKASAYVNYGNALMGVARYEDALKKFFSAIELYKKSNLKDRLREPYLNIGNCFYLMKDYNNAIKYYEYTKRFSDSNDVSQHKATLLNNLGEVYIILKQFEKAEKNLNIAYKINLNIGNQLYQCMNLLNLGSLKLHQGDFKQASSYLDEAQKLSEENNFIEQKHFSNYYKAELNKFLFEFQKANGKIEKTLLSNALFYIENAEKLTHDMNDKRKLLDVYELKSDIYILQQKFNEAYQTISKYINLKDSIFTLESKEKVMALESSKDNELKAKEIEFLLKENDYKSNLNYSLIVITLLVLIILYFIYYRYKVKHKQNLILEKIVDERTQELREINVKIQNRLNNEKEINDLKTNIILNISHQFRTPLTAISSYLEIIKIKSSDHPELEKPIDNSLKSISELTKLIDKVENYNEINSTNKQINLEEIKLENLINDAVNKAKNNHKNSPEIIISNKIGEYIIKSDRNLLLTSLSNIIDNSIKFNKNNNEVLIDLNIENNKLKIDILDKGEGISDKDLNHIFEPLFVGKKHIGLKKGNGLGLTITKSNIELLNGTLIINSQENEGTIATIIL